MESGEWGTFGLADLHSFSSDNRLDVFDWLGDIPLSSYRTPYPIFEVSFNHGSRKEFFINAKHLRISKGDYVTVEGVNGFDVGTVSLCGELVKMQLKKKRIKEEDITKKLLRISGESDLEVFQKNKAKEKDFLIKSRIYAKQQNLEMKVSEVEIQADGRKVTIFYTANSRVDFRELLKVYASEFNARIEMRQIGARQESAKIGGIGSCGRELCCSTWLTEFKTVYTSAARYQNLSINQTKLSGPCGKLKCSLNFELDVYMEALESFPNHADTLQMKAGKVRLVKKDIFRKLMWYSYENQSKQYPLSIERVNEIIALNKDGVLPDDLEPEEILSTNKGSQVSIDAGFVNDVGQISLSALMRKKKKKQKDKKHPESKKTALAHQNNHKQKNTKGKAAQNNQSKTQGRANSGDNKTNKQRNNRNKAGNRPTNTQQNSQKQSENKKS